MSGAMTYGPFHGQSNFGHLPLVQLGCGVVLFVLLGRGVHELSDHTAPCTFLGFGRELNGLIRKLYGNLVHGQTRINWCWKGIGLLGCGT